MPKYTVEYNYKIKEWGQVEGLDANNPEDAKEQAREYVYDTFGISGDLSDFEIEDVREEV